MLFRIKAIAAAVLLTSSVIAAASPKQDFSFSTPGGQMVNLSSSRGKIVVLLFSGIQDPQCRDGLKALESLAERYQGKDVSIYWVSINPTTEVTNAQLRTPCGVTTSVQVVRDENQVAFK